MQLLHKVVTFALVAQGCSPEEVKDGPLPDYDVITDETEATSKKLESSIPVPGNEYELPLVRISLMASSLLLLCVSTGSYNC